MTLASVPLGDSWWESANRIAIHCAATHPAPRYLTHAERIDAALDALIQHVHENGWPATELKPLFLAASNGIEHATYEHTKHIGRGNYWVEPPGIIDPIAEAVTDKIGVRQVCYLFTLAELEAVEALAEVLKRGGTYKDAAALIGKTPSTVSSLLATARAKARQHWVAPGEHVPPGAYSTDRGGDAREWRKARRYKNRKRIRQAA
jgi:hypothetical protein